MLKTYPSFKDPGTRKKKIGVIRKFRNISPFVKGVVRQEIKIHARDLYRKITRRYPKIKAVVIDIDGTTVLGMIYNEIAAQYPGLQKIQGDILEKMRRKEIPFNLGFKQIMEEYIKKGVSVASAQKAIRKVVQEGKLNAPIISAGKYLQRNYGVDIILATRTSKLVADALNGELGFNGAIGSQEIIRDGKIVGIDNLIGIKREKLGKIPVLTKAQYIKAHKAVFPYKPKNIAFIAEEFSDIAVDNSGYEFFFNPKNPIEPKLTKYARKLRLYDKKLDQTDKEMRDKLISYVINPKTQYSKRLLKKEIERLRSERGLRNGSTDYK